MIREAADAGAAVLLTTHHLEEAEALADRILVMHGGRIIADGSPAAIKSRVAGAAIRCRTATPVPVLAALPAVVSAERMGADSLLLSGDAVTTVRALLGAAPDLDALTVGAASLEQALATLTDDQLEAA